MKNFKTFLRETHTSHQNQAIDNNMNMGVYSDPAVVRKLNAWVGTIAGNYVLPELEKVEPVIKLLTSKFNESEENEIFSLPLSKYCVSKIVYVAGLLFK